MKTSTGLASCILIAVTFLLAACSSSDGPLLVNTSGASVAIVVHSSDGSTFRGTIADHDAVWAGKPRSEVQRIEIAAAGQDYVIAGDDLHVPYGKDATSAFIIEKSGPRKLTLQEARILMRNR